MERFSGRFVDPKSVTQWSGSTFMDFYYDISIINCLSHTVIKSSTMDTTSALLLFIFEISMGILNEFFLTISPIKQVGPSSSICSARQASLTLPMLQMHNMGRQSAARLGLDFKFKTRGGTNQPRFNQSERCTRNAMWHVDDSVRFTVCKMPWLGFD